MIEKLKGYVFKAILLVFKVALALVLVVIMFAGLAFGLDRYYRSPLQRFCSQVEINKPVSDGIAQAEQHAFLVFDQRDKHGKVGILNHQPFYFRYECAITVVDDVVTQTKMLVAD
ncbi:hypothetical protein [Motilimonas eburnea]|uniref:hypothetical protein n=1 Tax=Motilimonas eburnea TaxID=1737488 RepID=UPI001E5969AF|nr:hypothetical protein [Motilimonas eburnea]MCE2571203.1 hypothetical protein [Motilimonas eburnea]